MYSVSMQVSQLSSNILRSILHTRVLGTVTTKTEVATLSDSRRATPRLLSHLRPTARPVRHFAFSHTTVNSRTHRPAVAVETPTWSYHVYCMMTAYTCHNMSLRYFGRGHIHSKLPIIHSNIHPPSSRQIRAWWSFGG